MYIGCYIKPHGKHKPKIHNRYTKINRKEDEHNTKESHQIIRKESKKEGTETKKNKHRQLTKWQ